jgi:PAS domain S-box-containing protein
MDDLKTGKGPSEAIFRRLVEEVRDYAIFLLDPDGRVASWNAGAEAIKGYRAEEILGRHFSVFYPREAVESGWPEIELATARAERRFEDEGWRVRKDGSRFWANVVITALHDDGGGLLGFAKITRDMTERRRVESLEESGRRVSEFLAVLAHELRNPLAPIRNAVAVLRASGGDARGTEWARDVIDRQVNYLTRLVDDLLDVSRITRGKITLRPETVPVGEIASAAVEAVRPLVEERKQELRVSVPDETVRVRGDRIRLVQILVNLLHNAAKYTPERGWIRLALERRGEEAVFTVRDSGIGMTPELLASAFEMFTQGRQSLDRSPGGLGVGLTLVHRLVELHGGSVQAASEGPGRGSEFVVRLPLAPESEDAPAEAADRAGVPPRPAVRRVLVVDDSRDSADSLAALVGLWGHEARVAYSGPAALDVAAEFRPEIVLLDVGLPELSGLEVARRLRAGADLRPLTLIAITGYGRAEDRRLSTAAGFDHHLVKPVDPAVLRGLLAGHGLPAGVAGP